MPTAPLPNKIPSEHTIEVLANHYLLYSLNKARCWIFCPTTNEELALGYDASTRNTKSILIQYKALRYASASSVSIKIDSAQLTNLLLNFPKRKSAYVFFGFCLHKDYSEIDAGYKSAQSPVFFDKCIFVDLHSLPAATTGLRYSFIKNEVYPVISGTTKSRVSYLNGPRLVCEIVSCAIGDRHTKRKANENERRDIYQPRKRISGFAVINVPIG